MNRLAEIKRLKAIYAERLLEADTELSHDLIQIQINKLSAEERELLER